MNSASFLRLPNFYPVNWALGAALLYIGLIGAGLYSALFLRMLAALSGNMLMAVAVPGVILIVEFVLVPILKFPSLLGKSCAAMRAFLAEDRMAAEAWSHEARAWSLRDWLVLLMLTASFLIKAYVLTAFGTFQPEGLMLANWIIAIADFAAHLSGVTSKIPYYGMAQLIDWRHHRNRLSKVARIGEESGSNALGSLAYREFEFESPVTLRDDEVDGHILEHKPDTMKWIFRAPGTLDDGDRAAFLHRQGDALNQATLARALAKIQLDLLDAPEMRPGSGPAGPAPTPVSKPLSPTAPPSATAIPIAAA